MSNLCWDQHIERLSLPPGEQIIGPMICLGGVERRAVAAALAALSGSSDSFFTVAVLGQAAKRLVKDAFDRENVKNFSIMDLTARRHSELTYRLISDHPLKSCITNLIF